MLSRILREFEKTEGPIDLKELSRRLEVDPSALDGMIELLVRQGKLRQIDSGNCARCDKRIFKECASLPAPAERKPTPSTCNAH